MFAAVAAPLLGRFDPSRIDRSKLLRRFREMPVPVDSFALFKLKDAGNQKAQQDLAAAIMSTDFGQLQSPRPAVGMRMFIAEMLGQGVPVAALDWMGEETKQRVRKLLTRYQPGQARAGTATATGSHTASDAAASGRS